MDKIFEEKYHRLEETHWWFVTRRKIILQLLKNTSKGAKILDVGCSGGALIKFLRQKGFFNTFGIDTSPQAIECCEKQGLNNVSVCDAAKTSFLKEDFDVIIASDILEHIDDENSALNEWRRILRPNGKLIIFVPAFRFLWSGHDVANQHKRRYVRENLIILLHNARFQIARCSYWNFFLFGPAALLRVSGRLFCKNKKGAQKPSASLKDDLCPVPAFFNNLLIGLLRFENWLLGWLDFPFGVSLFAVGKNKL